MKIDNKKIMLGIVLVVIVASIILLDQTSVHPISNSERVAINVSDSKINAEKEKIYPRAIELVKPNGYINSDNFTLSQFIGKKVILLDFWDYTCINCQRTFPYLNAWYSKYKDQGFVIVGIHTPEFEFEKSYGNVKLATERFNISYPVVLDNDYRTWQAYRNQYWPRKYLIDIDGFIVHNHIGEGGYDDTEKEIQKLLNERIDRLKVSENISSGLVEPDSSSDISKIGSPEMYLGYGFNRGGLGNPEGYLDDSIVNYTFPPKFKLNNFYLQGLWYNHNDNLESESLNNSILVDFSSKSINMVAGSDTPLNISVYVDDSFIHDIEVSNYQLYNLYTGKDYSEHKIKIVVGKGVKVFTFTFG